MNKRKLNLIASIGFCALVLTIGLASAGLNQADNADDTSGLDQCANTCQNNVPGNCSQQRYRHQNLNVNGECTGPCNSVEQRTRNEYLGGCGSRNRNRNGIGSGCCVQK